MAMKPRTQKIIIGIFFSMCAVIGLMYLIQWFSPTEEDLKTVATLNNHREMLEKGGHVNSVNFVNTSKEMLEMIDKIQSLPEERKERWKQHIAERDDNRNPDEKDRLFWADIYDENGKKIGIIRGFRVEGFGIARPYYEWLDENGNVIEHTEERGFGGRRGRGRGDRGSGPEPGSGGE